MLSFWVAKRGVQFHFLRTLSSVSLASSPGDARQRGPSCRSSSRHGIRPSDFGHCIHHRVETPPPSRQVITGNIPFGGKGVAVGQIAESKRTFTQADVDAYAALIWDPNPLHQFSIQNVNDADANDKGNDGAVVHGMLVASLFSHIFGTLIPGAVYRQQSLQFRNFVHVNDAVVGRIRVLEVRSLRRGGVRIVHCATDVYHEETQQICIQGEAEVVLTEE